MEVSRVGIYNIPKRMDFKLKSFGQDVKKQIPFIFNNLYKLINKRRNHLWN